MYTIRLHDIHHYAVKSCNVYSTVWRRTKILSPHLWVSHEESRSHTLLLGDQFCIFPSRPVFYAHGNTASILTGITIGYLPPSPLIAVSMPRRERSLWVSWDAEQAALLRNDVPTMRSSSSSSLISSSSSPTSNLTLSSGPSGTPTWGSVAIGALAISTTGWTANLDDLTGVCGSTAVPEETVSTWIKWGLSGRNLTMAITIKELHYQQGQGHHYWNGSCSPLSLVSSKIFSNSIRITNPAMSIPSWWDR